MDEPTTTSSSNTNRKRTKDYSEKVWLKRMRKDECNVLLSKELALTMTIESLRIGDKTYVYTENQNCEYDIMLSQNTFTIKTGDNNKINLSCKNIRTKQFLRAKFLWEKVSLFPEMVEVTDAAIDCLAKKAREVTGFDSDEQIPEPEIPAEFDNNKLSMVRCAFRMFFEVYQLCKVVGLGKRNFCRKLGCIRIYAVDQV